MNRLQCIITLILIHVLVVTSPSASLATTTIRLSSAASLTAIVQQLIDHYQTIHPEQTVQANLASSGSLAKQIIAGAEADLYISANTKWMDYLNQNQAVVPESLAILTHNSLVCVGLANREIVKLESLTTLKKIALGNPSSSPAGEYAQIALQNKQLYRTLLNDGQLVFAKDVRQALVYAEQNWVDAALLYATDAAMAQNIDVLFTVPPHLYPPITYPMALTHSGSKKTQVKQFYQFLSSPQAQHIFHQHGFK